MNSTDIYAVIEKIAATSSKLEKQAIIAKHVTDETFKRVLVAALDPLTTYGIEAIPEYSPGAGGNFTEETWNFLTRLALRQTTGNAALNELKVVLDGLSFGSAQLLVAIITKDLRAGFGESTVNKAIPGLIQDFPYMRCCLPKDTNLAKFYWAAGVFSQEKADGMFANLNREVDGTVTLHSRQGSRFPMSQFGAMAQEASLALNAGTQTHGELLVCKGGWLLPREQSNGILNGVLQGGVFEADEEPTYLVWDQIPLSAAVSKGKYPSPYSVRFESLRAQVDTAGDTIRAIDTRIVHSLADAYTHYRELLARGKEGVVVKDPRAIWRDGDSKEQVKLKLAADCDLKIVGFTPGKGKNEATFGSVTCRTADDLLEVGVSGFKDAVRRDIHARREALLGSVMTVKANGIMNPANDGDLHSLFLPRFVELRLDKTQADTLQRVRDQFEAAVLAA